ncbi:hypothetical protein ACLKA6_008191 [Drosophila palustris]
MLIQQTSQRQQRQQQALGGKVEGKMLMPLPTLLDFDIDVDVDCAAGSDIIVMRRFISNKGLTGQQTTKLQHT